MKFKQYINNLAWVGIITRKPNLFTIEWKQSSQSQPWWELPSKRSNSTKQQTTIIARSASATIATLPTHWPYSLETQTDRTNRRDPPSADFLSSNGPLSDELLAIHGIPPLTALQELMPTESPSAPPATAPSRFPSATWTIPTSISRLGIVRNGSWPQSMPSTEHPTLASIVPSSLRQNSALHTKPVGTTEVAQLKIHGSLSQTMAPLLVATRCCMEKTIGAPILLATPLPLEWTMVRTCGLVNLSNEDCRIAVSLMCIRFTNF